MTYVALLRGINVGGKNKVEMRSLARVFERAGMSRVRTYIASGNVIFTCADTSPDALAELLEREIDSEFGFGVRVLVVPGPRILDIARELPESWSNDSEHKCDVMFLWDDADGAELLATVALNPGIEQVVDAPGALMWRVQRAHATKSKMLKLSGAAHYARMTVRNCNTLRRLAEIVSAVDAESEAT
jgi:uncharacterized protein (DUF1697 family)